MERASARRAPDQGPSSLHPTTRRPEAPGEAPHPLDGHPPEYPDEATHGPTHPRERPLVGQTPQKHALTERHPRRVWGRTATPLPQPGGRRRRAADDVHPSGTSIESQSARGGAQRSRPRPNAPKRAPAAPTHQSNPPADGANRGGTEPWREGAPRGPRPGGRAPQRKVKPLHGGTGPSPRTSRPRRWTPRSSGTSGARQPPGPQKKPAPPRATPRRTRAPRETGRGDPARTGATGRSRRRSKPGRRRSNQTPLRALDGAIKSRRPETQGGLLDTTEAP